MIFSSQVQLHNAAWRAESTSSGFPDLSKHNNWMAKIITEEIYNNLKDKVTKYGVTLDKCIQTGMIIIFVSVLKKFVTKWPVRLVVGLG